MANLKDYITFYPTFHWQKICDELAGLPGGKGLNIAHEAVDRHADGDLKNTVALRWIRKDQTTREATYFKLKKQTARFANVLESLPKTKSGKILRRLLKARELGLPEGDLSTLEQA